MLSLVLTSCGALKDVGVASSQLNSENQAAGLQTLKELANAGYVEAQEALAVYYSDRLDEEGIKTAGYWFSKLKGRSEKSELLYTRWMANLGTAFPQYQEQAYQTLLVRQRRYKDVTVELARFYKEANIVDKQELPTRLKNLLANVQLSPRDKLRVIDTLQVGNLNLDTVNRHCANLTKGKALYCLRIKARQFMRTQNETPDALIPEITRAYVEEQVNGNYLASIISIFLSTDLGSPRPEIAFEIVQRTDPASDELFLVLAESEVKKKYNFELDQLIERLTFLHNQGDTEASLLLGNLYDFGKRVAEDPWKAVEYYRVAEEIPEARFREGIILLSGKLGAQHLDEGIERLLSAARDQYTPAYRELFHVFAGYSGIRVNPLYAHIFASVYQSYGDDLTEYDHQMLARLPLSPALQNSYQTMLSDELNSKSIESMSLAQGNFMKPGGMHEN